MVRQLFATVRNLLRDRRGNVAIITGLAIVPLVGMAGLAMDYSMMLSTKARLDQAADAAAIAGVATARSYIVSYTGNGSPTSAAQTSGQAQAQAQFNANTGKLPPGSLTISSLTVKRTGQTITGTVSYSYQMPTFVMSVLGIRTMTVKGTSTSTLTMPTYVNVYVVIDVSSSMGVGATLADQQKVYDATGCALACHYVNKGQVDTVVQAHVAGAKLRIDVAKSAMYSGLQQILNAQSSSNPTYKVAVYTMSAKFTQVFALSSDIQGAMNAIGQDYTSGIDISSVNKDGGTDTTYALKTLASQLSSAGDGSTSQKAQGFVILVTDGVQDQDTKVYNSSTQSYADQANPAFTVFSPCNQSSCQYFSNFGLYFEAFDPTQCNSIKNLNYTMMTLNVQYLIPPSNIQGGSQALHDVFDYVQGYLASSISTNLTSCATSSSYAYSASTPAEITAATKSIFGAIPAVSQARLSQ